MYCKFLLHVDAIIGTSFFCQWWGSCLLCFPNYSMSKCGPSHKGFPDCRGWDLSYRGVKTWVVYINQSLLPIRRIAPAMCFTTLITKFTVLAQNFLLCSTSPLDSVWVTVVVYVGSVKIFGGYLNPWPVGTSVSEASSSVCLFVVLWGAFLFLDLIWHFWASSIVWYFSILVWVSWTMVSFPHVVLTLICTSRAPAGILQNRNPFRLQAVLSDLLNAIL